MQKTPQIKFNMLLPPTIFLSDAVIAFALDLANGDVEDERIIINVDYEEINSTHDDFNP